MKIRNKSGPRTLQRHTARGKRSLKYTGIEVWAAFPESLKHMSHKSFKYHLKDFMVKNS